MMCPLRIGLLGVLAACGSGGGFPDAPEADGPPPPGTFTLEWNLTDTNNAAVTCPQIGGQSVTALMRDRNRQGGFTEVFTCTTGMGTSQALQPSIYDIAFELVGPGGTPPDGVIATAPMQMGIVIESGQNVRLAPVTFAVDATGGLKLTLNSGATGGNCAATAQNGAGITTMTLTLEHAGDGACEPVTFAIGAGATRPAGTYTVNCATPVVASCIENDQQLSVAGVTSGPYVVRAQGFRGAAACYTNIDNLPVPPLGRDLTRTLNLALQSAVPGCM